MFEIADKVSRLDEGFVAQKEAFADRGGRVSRRGPLYAARVIIYMLSGEQLPRVC